MVYKLIVIMAVFCLGCGTQKAVIDIKTDCPPPLSREQIIEELTASQSGLIEFAARGSATVRFLAEDRTESLPIVTGYFSDRQNVVVKVSHTFGTAMLLGTNPNWFWCWINFARINDYYSGDIARLTSCGAKGLKTFPVAEVFGIVDAAALSGSAAVFEDGRYRLDVFDAEGAKQRSYHFNNCSRKLVRIVYYDSGSAAVIAEFDGYKPLAGDTALATSIDVFSVHDNMRLSIKIDRFIPLSMTADKKAKLYSVPQPASGANVYMLDENCRFVPR